MDDLQTNPPFIFVLMLAAGSGLTLGGAIFSITHRAAPSWLCGVGLGFAVAGRILLA